MANEKKRVQDELARTQQQLEIQMNQTLQLRKQQQRRNASLLEKEASIVSSNEDRINDLERQLVKTQGELTKELTLANDRDAKLQKTVDQNADLQNEVQQLRQKEVDAETSASAVKRLERQRDCLLSLVKKQMKLMEVLKEQSLNAKAAALLDITEKDFMKELK